MLQVLVRLAPSVFFLVIAIRMRQAVARFQEADARSPDRARTLAEIGLRGGPPVKLLTRRGVLVESGTGRYYLDDTAYQRWRRRRGRVLTVVLVALGLLGLGILLTR